MRACVCVCACVLVWACGRACGYVHVRVGVHTCIELMIKGMCTVMIRKATRGFWDRGALPLSRSPPPPQRGYCGYQCDALQHELGEVIVLRDVNTWQNKS